MLATEYLKKKKGWKKKQSNVFNDGDLKTVVTISGIFITDFP